MELKVIKNEGLYYTVEIKYSWFEKLFGSKDETVTYKLFGSTSLINKEGNTYYFIEGGFNGEVCKCVYNFKIKQENIKLYNLG